MSAAPHVSVCVPAYNSEAYLRETLDSILASDHDDFEVVVLDNASTDKTAAITRELADPRVRLVHNHTLLPLPDNWNHVIGLARGDLVKLVCADDLIRPDALRLQADVLDADAGVALVAGRRHLIDGAGRLLVANTGLHRLVGRFTQAEVVARVIRDGGNPLGETAAGMFRRADFEASGGFDPELFFPMDLEMWIRLLGAGDFVGIRDAVAAFRASSGSLSSARSELQYAEQRELTRRLVADPRWRTSVVDRVWSRFGARLALARRQLLFWLAEHPRVGHLGGRAAVRTPKEWLAEERKRRASISRD